MDLEETVKRAIVDELKRQTDGGGMTRVEPRGDDRLALEGEVDLAALAMVIVGSLAGGP